MALVELDHGSMEATTSVMEALKDHPLQMDFVNQVVEVNDASLMVLDHLMNNLNLWNFLNMNYLNYYCLLDYFQHKSSLHGNVERVVLISKLNEAAPYMWNRYSYSAL